MSYEIFTNSVTIIEIKRLAQEYPSKIVCFLNETSAKGGTSVIRRERFLNRFILSTVIVNYFVSNLQTSDRRKVMPKLL